MTIRVLAPALLAAAALPAAEPELKISPTLYLQTRADIASGSDAAGGDYTPGTEMTTEGDTVDFYLRRARLGAKMSLGNLSGQVVFQADNYSRGGSAQSVGVYDALARYAFKGDVSHELRAGLYQAMVNPSSLGSAWALVPAAAATEHLAANRSVGVGYSLDTTSVDLHVDVMNPRTDGTADQGTSATADGDGLWISGRLALTPPGEWNLPRFQESYGGAPGKGVGLGIEYIVEDEQGSTYGAQPNNGTTTTTGLGLDVVFRLNGLTAMAEYRTQTMDPDSAVPDRDSSVIRLQAGYAFALAGGTAIEPGVRFQIIDLDGDNDDETTVYDTSLVGANSAKDFGSSGNQIDVGVNWYLSKQNHKLSAALTVWSAEDGDGDANIFRIQHQLVF